MIPAVKITKSDGSTGVVRPGVDGILAVIAPAEKGPQNVAAGYARPDLAYADYGSGPLAECAAYDMAVSGNPVVLLRSSTSTAAAYGAVTFTGTGTSVPTAHTATTPLDDFNALITVVAGGTVGTTGITYTYSLDSGTTTSGVQSLGTLTTLTIPSTGVAFDLAAGTLVAGDTIACPVTGPKMTSADLTTALEALRVYGGAWEAVLIYADADNTFVSAVDTWLAAREGEGKYRTAVMNARHKTASESETSYSTAMTTVMGAMATTRVVFAADAADMTSPLRGVVQARPAALFMAARGMSVDIGRDIAYVADGPLTGASIRDTRGNPKWHDEALYPGLDDIRMATLRTFSGKAGVYVNNPLLASAPGSDYVFWQHARVMNSAGDLVFQVLTNQLSLGVRKDPKTGHILEEDAQLLEGLVNDRLKAQLVDTKRVSAAAFVLSRTDDLSANSGASLTGTLSIQALAYVKKFNVNARFTRTIAVSV